MANTCSNITTISGPPEDITEFINTVTTVDGDSLITDIANSLMPIPESLKETNASFASEEPHPNWAVMLADGSITQEGYDNLVALNAEDWEKQQQNLATHGVKDWYDWALKNWGTKWGDHDHWEIPSEDQVETGEVFYRYDTANSPFNDAFWEKVSLMFPTLTFVTIYSEPGNSFCGASAAKDGSVITRYTVDLPECDDQEDYGDWLEDIETLSNNLGIEALKELTSAVSQVR
jgi:hypothetical protein